MEIISLNQATTKVSVWRLPSHLWELQFAVVSQTLCNRTQICHWTLSSRYVCVCVLKSCQPADHTGAPSVLIHSLVFPCPTTHSYIQFKSQLNTPFPRGLSDHCVAGSFCTSVVCFSNSQVTSCALIQDPAGPNLHCPTHILCTLPIENRPRKLSSGTTISQ